MFHRIIHRSPGGERRYCSSFCGAAETSEPPQTQVGHFHTESQSVISVKIISFSQTESEMLQLPVAWNQRRAMSPKCLLKYEQKVLGDMYYSSTVSNESLKSDL